MVTHSNEKRTPFLEVLCDEPFRLFFPAGLLCGVVGVSHWLWYYSGLTETFSCNYHGLLMIQGFEMGFATGFLMTALPRFMEVRRARPWELLLGLALLLFAAAELYVENWSMSEVGFLLLALHLLLFAARRFPERKHDPPPTFIFVPAGLIHALVGGLLILWPLYGFVKLGNRMVEQGMLLCFIMGVGPYLGGRLLSANDAASRHRHTPLGINLLLALALFVSFWIESGVLESAGRSLRAFVVTVHLLRTLPLFQRPASPLWHLRLLWLSFWFVIAGLWVAGLFPDYEIPALHLTFIGGFATLTVIIATRVTAAHCGFEAIWQKNSKTMLTLALCTLLALIARVISDFLPFYYFGMLHIGAAFWLIGVIAWGVVLLPKMSPRRISDEV